MITDENMTTTDLIAALGQGGQVDTFGIARWRTPDADVAVALEYEVRLLGFSVTVVRPVDTWHGMHAVVAWGSVPR